MGLLELDNEVFAGFAFYAALCLLKMMAMSLLTVRNRISKDVYANPEDLKLSEKKDLKTNLNDPDVERVRRNHLNDIENIIPFVLAGVLYVLIKPNPWVALMHFRTFAFARFAHTVVYQFAAPPPSRSLCFLIGYFTTISMAIQVVMATF
ncbi:microsomal glutathione S-transferase 1 [Lingula anatina]|uniref:Microsomal glutathione S-transferase 1 n=1 Tax=Lingula anatina TaxID=7574 RepID=A0A1S3H6K1_LINAN|nr:microsomal glutathione S-transferase 1 [Lingula anatina]|eukprot:XP_013381607.1 microsomal glutathione S-transferase 1 [Lingula anatina]